MLPGCRWKNKVSPTPCDAAGPACQSEAPSALAVRSFGTMKASFALTTPTEFDHEIIASQPQFEPVVRPPGIAPSA